MNKVIDLTIGTIAIGITLGHCIYALKTEKNKLIKVNKKYKFTKNGFTEFMIIDENGNHYNINNSIWYWKWDSIEDWHKIETSKEIVIKYYGWRIPLFGMFPNIIMSKQEEVLESISSSETRVIQYNYHKEARIKEEIEEISKPLNLYHELWKKISKYD
jgi:hypothetical protein